MCGAHPHARLLGGDLPRACAGAVLLRDGGAPSARLRRAAEVALGGAPDRYRDSGGERLEKLVAGIEGAVPILPAFPEQPEAEPANSSPGRALRCLLRRRRTPSRRTGQQLPGARPALRRGVPRDKRADQGRPGGHGAHARLRGARPGPEGARQGRGRISSKAGLGAGRRGRRGTDAGGGEAPRPEPAWARGAAAGAGGADRIRSIGILRPCPRLFSFPKPVLCRRPCAIRGVRLAPIKPAPGGASPDDFVPGLQGACSKRVPGAARGRRPPAGREPGSAEARGAGRRAGMRGERERARGGAGMMLRISRAGRVAAGGAGASALRSPWAPAPRPRRRRPPEAGGCAAPARRRARGRRPPPRRRATGISGIVFMQAAGGCAAPRAAARQSIPQSRPRRPRQGGFSRLKSELWDGLPRGEYFIGSRPGRGAWTASLAMSWCSAQ